MHLIIGSTTVDLFITGMAHLPALSGDEFSQDNLVFTDRPLQMTIGGNGANSAYVLGRLGAPVRLCSAVGEDELGALMCGWLEDAGVETGHLQRLDSAGTSTTTIIMDEALNRSSYHHGGAYAAFDPSALPTTWLDGVDALLLTSFPLMARLRPAYSRLLAQARARGVITIVDIGPAIGTPVTFKELAPLLAEIDFLVTNEHELGVCCAMEIGDDTADAVSLLIEARARTLIIKHGKWGATICQGGQRTLVPGFKVYARSTVGAGDSFNAGLMLALLQGWSPMEAVRFANATAALVVSAERSVLESPTVEEVQTFIDRMSPPVPT